MELASSKIPNIKAARLTDRKKIKIKRNERTELRRKSCGFFIDKWLNLK
jgi:hypothetical protein